MAAVKVNIKYIIFIEKYIAQTNYTMNTFYGKWASLFHNLQSHCMYIYIGEYACMYGI
jgi:hypothetical protein